MLTSQNIVHNPCLAVLFPPAGSRVSCFKVKCCAKRIISVSLGILTRMCHSGRAVRGCDDMGCREETMDCRDTVDGFFVYFLLGKFAATKGKNA